MPGALWPAGPAAPSLQAWAKENGSWHVELSVTYVRTTMISSGRDVGHPPPTWAALCTWLPGCRHMGCNSAPGSCGALPHAAGHRVTAKSGAYSLKLKGTRQPSTSSDSCLAACRVAHDGEAMRTGRLRRARALNATSLPRERGQREQSTTQGVPGAILASRTGARAMHGPCFRINTYRPIFNNRQPSYGLSGDCHTHHPSGSVARMGHALCAASAKLVPSTSSPGALQQLQPGRASVDAMAPHCSWQPCIRRRTIRASRLSSIS